MLRVVTFGFCLSLIFNYSCGTAKSNYQITKGYYRIDSIISNTSIPKDEVQVVGKLIDNQTNAVCSNGVVKSLINEKKMIFTDSVGGFKVSVKSGQVKLSFSHSGNSTLEIDTIFVDGGSLVEMSVFLGSERILD